MRMAAAGWSQMQGRKVCASMRKQRRIAISSTEREDVKNARESSPPPPSVTVLPLTSPASADFRPKMAANIA